MQQVALPIPGFSTLQASPSSPMERLVLMVRPAADQFSHMHVLSMHGFLRMKAHSHMHSQPSPGPGSSPVIWDQVKKPGKRRRASGEEDAVAVTHTSITESSGDWWTGLKASRNQMVFKGNNIQRPFYFHWQGKCQALPQGHTELMLEHYVQKHNLW